MSTALTRIRLAIQDIEKAIDDEDSMADLEIEDVVRDNIDEIEDLSEEDRELGKELAEKIEEAIRYHDDFEKAGRYLDALKELLPEQKRPALSRYLAEKEDEEEQRVANEELARLVVEGVSGLFSFLGRNVGHGAYLAGEQIKKWRK